MNLPNKDAVKRGFISILISLIIVVTIGSFYMLLRKASTMPSESQDIFGFNMNGEYYRFLANFRSMLH
jgi:hypothetical protein